MHQSFVSTAPHLRGWPGKSGAKVQGNYFLIVPTVSGEITGGLTLGTLPWLDFLLCRVGLRAGLLPDSVSDVIITLHGIVLTHLSLASFSWDIGKQNSPSCDAANRGVPSGAFLFAYRKNEIKMKNYS